MKTTEPKSSTSPALQRKSNGASFFQPEESQEGFFGSKKSEEPFFKPVTTLGKTTKPIQAKLTIGQPGDQYEQEADAMADKVVQRLAQSDFRQENGNEQFSSVNGFGAVQSKCAECEQEEQEQNEQISPKEDSLQRKPIFESESEPAIQAKLTPPPASSAQKQEAAPPEPEEEESIQEEPLQMKPVFDSPADPPDEDNSIQPMCADCAEKVNISQKSELSPEEAETPIQTKPGDNTESDTSAPDLESRLNATKGSGEPLPDDSRTSMESAFGADFSDVRVHTNSGAVQMNQELGAQAFTHGNDVYFGEGKYSPGSTEGQRLLGHELTHVVQQGEGNLIQRDLSDEELESRAGRIFNAVDGWGTTNETIFSALENLSSGEATRLISIYGRLYSARREGRSLPEDIAYEFENDYNTYRAYRLLHYNTPRQQQTFGSSRPSNTPYISVEPQMSKVLPGMVVTYDMHIGSAIYSSVRYQWYVYNDPQTIQRLARQGRYLVTRVTGPDSSRWENAQWSHIGHHRVVCMVQFGDQAPTFYEYIQEVSALPEVAESEGSEQRRGSEEQRESRGPSNLRIYNGSGRQIVVVGSENTYYVGHDTMYLAQGSWFYRPTGPWMVTAPNGQQIRESSDEGLEITFDKAGRWIIRLPVEIREEGRTILEFRQNVIDPSLVAAEEINSAPAADFLRFRAHLEIEYLKTSRNSEWSQINSRREPPYITSSDPNPVGATSDPEKVYHHFRIHPTNEGNRFRWYVRANDWEGAPGRMSYRRAQFGEVAGSRPNAPADISFSNELIDGERAWVRAGYLNTGSLSFTFIITTPGTYTIICDELDQGGEPTGRIGQYVQIVQTQQEASQTEGLRRHIRLVDENISKIQDASEVPVRAVFVDQETGQAMRLAMYVGPSYDDPRQITLLDLTPGVSRIEYEGNSIEAVLNDFNSGNAYPEGVVQISIPTNDSGIPSTGREFETTGSSSAGTAASGLGWASLGLAAAGIVAAFIPGGQGVAAYCFIAAAATGVGSGGLSLYDRLQQSEVDPTLVTIDILGIAASIFGGLSAFRALRYGTTVALASRTGRFLLWAGFGTDAVSGVLVTVDGVQRINQVLDSDLPRSEKIGAIVRILANLGLQGGLLMLSVRDLGQARNRVGSLLGDGISGNLSAATVHGLNILDDDILRGLRGATRENVEQIANMVRINKDMVQRMIRVEGVHAAQNSLENVGGLVRINNQIDLHPSMLASMSDDDVARLFAATRELDANRGNLAALSRENRIALDPDFAHSQGAQSFVHSGSYRLRFEHNLLRSDQYFENLIQEISLSDRASLNARRLFRNLTHSDRLRLFELYNVPVPSGAQNLNHQAANYAFNTNPRSVREFANQFEFYKAEFKHIADGIAENCRIQITNRVQQFQSRNSRNPLPNELESITREVTNELLGQAMTTTNQRNRNFSQAVNARAQQDLASSGDSRGISIQAQERMQGSYQQRLRELGSRVGGNRIQESLTGDELITVIRERNNANRINFDSESAAIYHQSKHYSEFPPSERSGSNVIENYLNSAKQTIGEGRVVRNAPTQGGGMSIHFSREITEGGNVYQTLAIVNVDENGRVVLASYQCRVSR